MEMKEKIRLAESALEYHTDLKSGFDEFIENYTKCPADYPLVSSLEEEIVEMNEMIDDGMKEAHEAIFGESTNEGADFVLQKVKSFLEEQK